MSKRVSGFELKLLHDSGKTPTIWPKAIISVDTNGVFNLLKVTNLDYIESYWYDEFEYISDYNDRDLALTVIECEIHMGSTTDYYGDNETWLEFNNIKELWRYRSLHNTELATK